MLHTDNLSFFKLPFIFVVLYFFCDSGMVLINLMIGMIGAYDDYSDLESYLWPFVGYQIYDLLPGCLLLFCTSAVALYRTNVHIVTKKNIFLLMINIMILLAINGLMSLLLPFFVNQTVEISIKVIFYLFSALFTYYFIKVMHTYFNKSSEPFIFTYANSSKIHRVLVVVLILFSFIVMNPYVELFKDWRDDSELFNKLSFVPQILTILWIVMLIIATRNCFTQAYVTLQLDRIGKSAIFATIYLVILNLALFAIQLLLLIIMDRGTLTAAYCIMGALFTAVLIHIIISDMMARKIVSRYFGRGK